MLRRHSPTAAVCAVCAITVMAHLWIARQSARRLERLMTSTFDGVPMIVEEWTPEEFPLIEAQRSIDYAPPRLLAAAAFEQESNSSGKEECPVDALQTKAPESGPVLRAEAKPLTPRQQQELAAVREVIEEEMPETSAEERDIWFEELKSLPAEVVRDLLQVRKQLRVLTPDHHLSGPGQLSHGLPTLPQVEQEISAEPVVQSRPLHADDWTSTREALEQAIAWSTHNLVNAETPGYKRWRVVLGDATSLSDETDERSGKERLFSIAGCGCRIASLSLNLDQGEIMPTGRELDLAIEGEGVFIVFHEPSQRFFYTRGGGWKLTADRRIVCLIDGQDYLIDLKLRIPVDATDLRINPDGSVEAKLPEHEGPQKLGQILLARLPMPSSLVSQGNGLLISRHEQEPQPDIPGTKGLGILRQGALERSNVDLEAEQQQRDHWQQLLKLLPSPGLPRTARESDRSPH